MLEKTLESKIAKYAKDKGCLCYKFSSPGKRAVPDRLIISPQGRVLFLEIKAPGKTPTKLQEKELKKLRNHFVKALWVDNFDAAKWHIDRIDYIL